MYTDSKEFISAILDMFEFEYIIDEISSISIENHEIIVRFKWDLDKILMFNIYVYEMWMG